ncbi:MAG: ABC transporter permease [Oscillospiraceae bacterium]|nr:ABC transporter permease [Oscillospiraceae bacterium]
MNMLVAFISSAIPLGVPLLFGSTGEIVTEKSGHLNLGIPGIMYVGAISGVIGAFLYEMSCGNVKEAMVPALAILIPLLCCILGSVLMGLIYSFLTVTLRANQNVTGLALTTFGIGLGNFFGGSLIKLVDSDMPSIILTATSSYFRTSLPFAGKLGWFGEIFLSHDFLTYAAIIIALVMNYVLNKTRVGLNLRAVGENPATADAAGINVTKYKYFFTCVGSAIAGLGGLQYVMAYANGVWSNNAFGDRGWMAIALVIFALWKPSMAIFGSFLFGALCNANNYIRGLGDATQELFKLLPYIVTLLVLIITSMRKKREHQPPQSLGLSYFREDR